MRLSKREQKPRDYSPLLLFTVGTQFNKVLEIASAALFENVVYYGAS
jgi:hypothetical protein